MELGKAIKGRRSVRVFRDKNVEDAKIRKLIEAATWAPSACNQQLWDYIIIRDDNTKSKIVHECACSSLVKKAPVVIAVTYEKENLNERFQAQSASAAVQNMLLEAHALGLGACWLAGIGSQSKLKSILNIPESKFVVCLVIVGYPKNTPKPPERKPLSEIMHYERYNKMKEDLPLTHNPNKWTMDQIIDYCNLTSRKTEPGTNMDVVNIWETAAILPHVFSVKKNRSVLDMFSYDGSLLGLFDEKKVDSFDVSHTTHLYTKEAAKKKTISLPKPDKKFDLITIMFKLERLPDETKKATLKYVKRVLAKDGKAVIAFRTKSSLYYPLYLMLKLVSGDNIKKTALYSFFGPYEPMTLNKVYDICEEQGLVVKEVDKYYLIPPTVSDVHQLYVQYKKSEKTNFVHRVWHHNRVSEFICDVLTWQGISKSMFGSVCVMEVSACNTQ